MVVMNREDIVAYAFPGGYPVYYIAKGHEVLCAPCAREEEGTLEARVNWEDDALCRDECSERIESAYGEE